MANWRGADILQVVCGPTGKACGKILWESKNTKEFSKGWIGKFKKDQADAGAEFAVLMTVAMPRDVRDFDYVDDVWVTNYRSAIDPTRTLGLNEFESLRIPSLGMTWGMVMCMSLPT